MTDAAHDILDQVLSAAAAAGADAAEAVLAERQALSVGVRLGKLEDVEREEARDLGVRVFVGARQASVSGSDISPSARQKLVERAVAMARLAPEDPYAGLAPAERLARGPYPDLQLFDPTEPSAERLEAMALEAEEAARAQPRVTNSNGGGASWSTGSWAMATSEGFRGQHRSSSFSASVSVIAGDADGMENGYDGRTTRWAEDLPSPAQFGVEAGRRAAARLGARKIDSTTAPVVFENRVALSLIGPLLGAISGPAIARGTSFLKDKLGQQLFTADVDIVEEPHRVRGLGSAPFDDEGVATVDRALIDRGVLTSWLLNVASARQLGLELTGHASRGLAGPPGVGPSNLTVRAGGRDVDGLLADAGRGLLVTSMFGPSLNGNTGDWSAGVSGFWFEGGQVAYPVSEITVAGNLIDIYARLIPGADLELHGASNSPSLLVDGLAIAGR